MSGVIRAAFRGGDIAMSLAMAVIAVYVAGIALFDEGALRGGAVGLGGVILLLSRPLAGGYKGGSRAIVSFLWLVDIALLVGFVFTIWWFFRTYEALWEGVVILEQEELHIALFGVLVVVELTRRAFGPILAGVCVVALIYAMFGARLPWFFSHAGFTYEETMRAVWYSFDGVFGLPAGIVATIVLVFIVFGALLEGTGAGAILLKMATAATARLRGGPAHAAIAASALFGTISGSPVANVVGTGVFTIPMIKRQGFPASFAGGVEAAASTGGQFTPPIMAAVAFLMAELVGVSYLVVAAAAILPALFYYLALFAAVYAEAVRRGIGAVPVAERPKITREDWLQSMRFVLPVVAVVAVLFAGRSPAAAGFWALISAVVVGLALDPELRRRPKPLLDALIGGGRQCGQLMIAVGAIGIAIGVINMTGLGLRFASLMTSLAEGSLILALVVAMFACLLLGMGLPTLPAYLIIVLIMGPAITKIGVPLLIVHLFVLYYGVLSCITPPVAIAAFAAAPIADSNPIATAAQAMRVAFVGFLIPFVFVYNPSTVLVLGVDWWPFLGVLVRVPLAIWLFASGMSGVETGRLTIVERLVRVGLGISLMTPFFTLQVASFVAGAGLVAFHRLRARSGAAAEASQADSA